MPLTPNSLPPTPAEPVPEALFGVALVDQSCWLEDQNSPCARDWIEEQATYPRSYLNVTPSQNGIREYLEGLLNVKRISAPRTVGDRVSSQIKQLADPRSCRVKDLSFESRIRSRSALM